VGLGYVVGGLFLGGWCVGVCFVVVTCGLGLRRLDVCRGFVVCPGIVVYPYRLSSLVVVRLGARSRNRPLGY